MQRRTLLIAFTTLPLARLSAQAQPVKTIYRVGLLATTTPVATWRTLPAYQAFLAELRTLGYMENANVVFEYRSAEGEWQRLPNLTITRTTSRSWHGRGDSP
jgi:hypothetical protein